MEGCIDGYKLYRGNHGDDSGFGIQSDSLWKPWPHSGATEALNPKP